MRETRPTDVVRVPRYIKTELNKKFPGIRTSTLFEVMYNTSLVKLEGILRNDKKKK